ncbi:MAG: hypothetical protein UHD09_07045 [Bifidobacterium sp.]|nr:hypothetical protein [Bifidobacterium sp.]
MNGGGEFLYVDDPTLRVSVLNDKEVRYEGEAYSLSALAQSLRGAKSLHGPTFFTYEGELLTDRRDRLEEPGDQE